MSSRPHGFVAMPFGRKAGRDGEPIDFNAVFEDSIRRALDGAVSRCCGPARRGAPASACGMRCGLEAWCSSIDTRTL